jgi:hypothetical protein
MTHAKKALDARASMQARMVVWHTAMRVGLLSLLGVCVQLMVSAVGWKHRNHRRQDAHRG